MHGMDERNREPEPLAALRLVEPQQVHFWHDDEGRFCAEIDGEVFTDVKPVRNFPVQARDRLISLLDAADEEIAILTTVHGLDPASRQALEAELEKRYFIPVIQAIHHIEGRFGITRWFVMTDRGERVFDVRERGDVRYYPGRRVVIRDADGNLYEIPDYDRLDWRSRLLLEEAT
ncbi:hypothetical protein HRbin17_01180 [bacterium HR17]|uniref:DUF1854 domain-containing protein n=1 Tax=Candidatus Fervidibacter japonicus TaxID=2035412 RepID=A0A2H5XBV5_9BACT|nr:hypothetical protein HRbin17_01180 [bacterium HR17]